MNKDPLAGTLPGVYFLLLAVKNVKDEVITFKPEIHFNGVMGMGIGMHMRY